MIYIISGLPGAGKSTYAKKLAEEHGGVVFATDKWMTELYWMDKSPEDGLAWALERTGRCEMKMIGCCQQLAEIGISGILDIGFVSRDCRSNVYQRLNKLNLDYEIHFLEVDKDLRWRRVQKRNSEKGPTFSFEVTREMFDFMEDHFDEIFENETNKKVVRVNNS